jgi:DEAD/DEAH box helicase domain-containing protein
VRTDVRPASRLGLEQILDRIASEAELADSICRWQRLPARPARYADHPDWLDERLVAALAARGVTRLYTHQRHAFDALHAGRHVVVVTPTASGKTLCYDVPVVDTIAKDPNARALYIFPTKALAQDQLAALERLAAGIDIELRTFTYDGDTPPEARAAIRTAGHVVITNPDMLHTGILPHHTKWVRLFENLRYVVLDELHTYRGVFGSHVANVIRRLRRICAFYGSDPIFVFTSATIANPLELARRHLGEGDLELVDDDGSPRGEKVVAILNPPVVNAALGIRGSALLFARDLAGHFLTAGIQTIAFTRSRMSAELLLTYLRAHFPHPQYPLDMVRGYRGGYLPNERRAIERGLRDGQVRGVVSTNALELGIDIGALDVSVLVGYPGTVASTWQQMGRAGRRESLSAAFLVCTSSPVDQFIARHPEYVLDRSAEAGLVNPDNLHLLVSHLKCGAFELPWRRNDRFGTEDTPGVLSYLAEQGILHEADERYHWAAEAFPANDISLRTASTDNVVIIDTSAPRTRVIGEIDRFAAPTRVHEGAIYFHESRQYQVERFDHEHGKAFVRPVDVDYHTDADLAVRIRVLDEFARSDRSGHGEVLVSALPTIYKKIRLYTHENVGWGKIHLPESELQTTAFWTYLTARETSRLARAHIEVGIAGLGQLLHGIAPVFLMCDTHDLGVASEVRSPHTTAPTVYLYDAVPGGIGFAERLFRIGDVLLQRALEHLDACGCDDGCPSCVGPAAALGADVKRATRDVLVLMR